MRNALIALCALSALGCVDHRSGLTGFQNLGQVSFATRHRLPIGVARAVDVAVANFDRDATGRADLAVLDLDGAARLLFHRLDRKGEFDEGPSFRISGTPLAIRAADLDGDGDQDLCVVSDGSNEATVLQNRGNGRFDLTQSFDVQALPTGMVLGDYDGDGLPDMIVTHLSRSDLLLFKGGGDGTFAFPEALPIPRGTRTAGLAVADVTDDGFNDVLICDTDNDRIVVIRGTAGGLSRDPDDAVVVPVGRTPIGIALDTAAGGGVTIAVSNFDSETIDLLRHDGSGDFTVVRTLAVSGQPANAIFADVTGDGIVDLSVCVLDRSSVSIFAGDASGLTDDELQMPATGFPYRPLVADLVGDPGTDLVLVSNEIRQINVYEASPAGVIGGRTFATTIPTPQMVAAADFDGDGTDELVAGGNASSQLVLLEPSPAGGPGLRTALEIDLGRAIVNLLACDADGDGRVDVLAAVNGGVKVLANRSLPGAVAFELLPPGDAVFAPGELPAEIACDDVTGDGLRDLVVTYFGSETVAVLRGRGPFDWRAPVVTPVPGNPLGLAVFDQDGDGELEIAVCRTSASQLAVFECDARGVLTERSHIELRDGPNFVRRVDLDRNGRDDLVVASAIGDVVTFLVTSESGVFREQRFPTGRVPTALLIHDLDFDGNPDVLVATLTGADFRVLIGDGNGGVERTVEFAGTYGTASAALLDLDADRLPDLVLGSVLTERVTMFENTSFTGAVRID